MGARVRKQGNMAELGVTGLEYRAGRVYEEWLPQLKWPRNQAIYAEMRDNDPIVGALLFAVDMLIRGVPWWVEPATKDSADVEIAAFIEDALSDMSTSWEATVSEILSLLSQGFSYHELIYKRRDGQSRDPSRRSRFNDGRLGWRKIPIRAQQTIWRWEFADDGGVEAAVQRDPNNPGKVVPIPIQKALLFRTTHHKGNPEGRSVLRNAFRPWWFKKRIEEVEAIGIERDLAGLPVAYVPNRIMSAQAAADDKAIFDAITNIIRNVRRDEQEGVVFPGDRDVNGNRLYEMDLLSTGGQRQLDVNGVITRYDQRILMTALADFILLGHEKVGSLALFSGETAIFSTALDAWLDEIATVMNRHAIPRLLLLNGIDIEEQPSLMHGNVEQVDLGELGEYIGRLAGAGAPLFPDGELENALREKAGLPQRPEGEGDEEPIAIPRESEEGEEESLEEEMV